MLAFRDIADVALDHSPAIDQVNVADELHMFTLTRFGFQRDILVTDVLIVLQLPHGFLAGRDILDRADLPERLADQLALE